ncbi:hypothetical protein QTP88_001866 [Uroleucon formosanum]
MPKYKVSDNTRLNSFVNHFGREVFSTDGIVLFCKICECYIHTIEKIRSYVENKKIWVTLDETTDIEGRYVANVVVGTLELNGPGKHFLINTEVLEKAPSRVQIFKEHAPNILLPPQPVLTRWGTWLTAAFYYCEHFGTIKNIITKLDKNDATSIKKVIDLIADPDLELNLVFIKSYFGSLPNSITRLESSNICLADSIGIVEEQKNKIQLAKNIVGREIQHKF